MAQWSSAEWVKAKLSLDIKKTTSNVITSHTKNYNSSLATKSLPLQYRNCCQSVFIQYLK